MARPRKPAVSRDPAELSVTQAAKLIGVSRARVYQRITGEAGGWDAGRPLPAASRPSEGRGTRNGRQLKIELDVALAWRAEREAAGQPVGPLPDALAEHATPTPPPVPPVAPIAMPVGMPNFSPF